MRGSNIKPIQESLCSARARKERLRKKREAVTLADAREES